MRIAKLAIVLLLGAACTKQVKVETSPTTGKVDVDVQKPGEPQKYNGTINAVGTSGITGTATGTTGHDQTSVTVNVAGLTAGATYPWHIHEGKCSDAGAPVVGAATAYPALVAGADGRATASATVAVGLNEAKNYIINVHASPTNMATIVACGDFND